MVLNSTYILNLFLNVCRFKHSACCVCMCVCVYKVTQGFWDPIYKSLRVFQCHLEPSWTPWQSGAVQQHSSSSCGQEPLTPQQTDGNEKRLQQPMAACFICWETWLLPQLCGHCLWMQTIRLQECRAGRRRGLVKLWLHQPMQVFISNSFIYRNIPQIIASLTWC